MDRRACGVLLSLMLRVALTWADDSDASGIKLPSENIVGDAVEHTGRMSKKEILSMYEDEDLNDEAEDSEGDDESEYYYEEDEETYEDDDELIDEGGGVGRANTSAEIANSRLKNLLSDAKVAMGLETGKMDSTGLREKSPGREASRIEHPTDSDSGTDKTVIVGLKSNKHHPEISEDESMESSVYYDEDDDDEEDEDSGAESDDLYDDEDEDEMPEMTDLTQKHDAVLSKRQSGNATGAGTVDNTLRSVLEKQVELLLGRARRLASLDDPADFPTELQEGMDNYELDVDVIKIREVVKSFKFRSAAKRIRQLNGEVRRWPHKEGLRRKDPAGSCGLPVCAVVDSRPKRFRSLCELAHYMKRFGLHRRVLEVQKGACEDVIDGIGLDRDWSSRPPSNCNACKRDKAGCATPICVNDNGVARSFNNVCQAVKHLSGKRDVAVVALGLGTCRALYSSCLFTEWWDLDEPCHGAEVESVYATNQFANSLGRHGLHRSCPNGKIRYPAEFATTDGQFVNKDNKRLVFTLDRDRIQCLNKQNKKKPQPPNHWSDPTVFCRDFKMRYCCKDLWGEGQSLAAVASKFNLGRDDVLVDPPGRETLFDECNWLNFMSVSSGGRIGDVESRDKNYPFMKKSTCKQARWGAVYVDARRVQDDLPWDETGEIITKNSPTYGFYCDAKNNAVFGKKCSDYKVRFCCLKEDPSHWSQWGEWSHCSKSCGGGERTRKRRCLSKTTSKTGCFNGGPHGDKRFREQTQPCNRKSCPKDLEWQPWTAWSPCSATCGRGVRRRRRGCHPARSGGRECPPGGHADYTEESECHQNPCVEPQWTPWSRWSACSSSCGLGSRNRRRSCVDVASPGRPLDGDHKQLCLGPDSHTEDCDPGLCPVNGGWTQWQNWGECSVACGDRGFRRRQRACANPFPVNGGKHCPGDAEERGACQNLEPCPEHCVHSMWGEWSECSSTCGNGPDAGTRTRKRHIAQQATHGGLKCGDCLEQAERCLLCTPKYKEPGCIGACPIDCELSDWSDWTPACMPNCYTSATRELVRKIRPIRIRYVKQDREAGGKPCLGADGREITSTKGYAVEERRCVPDQDVPPCPEKSRGRFHWALWEEWDYCGADCGKTGKQRRLRKCIYNPTISEMKGRKKKHKSKKWMKRKKHKQCRGSREQYQDCKNICPETGWTDWDAWSPCQKTCGKGESVRRRTCRDDKRADVSPDKASCRGDQRQTRTCDAGPCDREEALRFMGKDSTGLSGKASKAGVNLPITSGKGMDDDLMTMLAGKNADLTPRRKDYVPRHQEHRQQLGRGKNEEGETLTHAPTNAMKSNSKKVGMESRNLGKDTDRPKSAKANPSDVDSLANGGAIGVPINDEQTVEIRVVKKDNVDLDNDLQLHDENSPSKPVRSPPVIENKQQQRWIGNGRNRKPFKRRNRPRTAKRRNHGRRRKPRRQWHHIRRKPRKNPKIAKRVNNRKVGELFTAATKDEEKLPDDEEDEEEEESVEAFDTWDDDAFFAEHPFDIKYHF